jgi:hypothetical protein
MHTKTVEMVMKTRLTLASDWPLGFGVPSSTASLGKRGDMFVGAR